MIVTIVTPTLNAIEYLRDCIESAKRGNSRFVEVEHVIVDGGSTDGTVEMARSYGLTVLTGKDSGIFDAINKGSFASSGELLGFLGADDVLIDGALDLVVKTYRETNLPWVVGGIEWVDGRGRGLGGLAAPPSWMTPRMLASLGWNPTMHMGTYFSRKFFTELGGFDIAYKDVGDYEMFSRARLISRYGRIAHPIAQFRRTGMNNSAIPSARLSNEIDRVRATFGPRSNVELRFWRVVLKAWFNTCNPTWVTSKIVDTAKTRLGLQKIAHF